MTNPINPLDMSVGGIDMTLDTKKVAEPKKGEFANIFAQVFNTANATLKESGMATEPLVTGKLKSTHQMSIQGAKAELMLHLTTQVASKLSQATTQLFQMQM